LDKITKIEVRYMYGPKANLDFKVLCFKITWIIETKPAKTKVSNIVSNQFEGAYQPTVKPSGNENLTSPMPREPRLIRYRSVYVTVVASAVKRAA
jgi:hypothetical protein